MNYANEEIKTDSVVVAVDSVLVAGWDRMQRSMVRACEAISDWQCRSSAHRHGRWRTRPHRLRTSDSRCSKS